MNDMEKAKGLCSQFLASGKYGFLESCLLAALASKVAPAEVEELYPSDHEARLHLSSPDFDSAMEVIAGDSGWIKPDPAHIAARHELEYGAFQIRYVHEHIRVARVDVFDRHAVFQTRHYYSTVEDMIQDLSQEQ